MATLKTIPKTGQIWLYKDFGRCEIIETIRGSKIDSPRCVVYRTSAGKFYDTLDDFWQYHTWTDQVVNQPQAEPIQSVSTDQLEAVIMIIQMTFEDRMDQSVTAGELLSALKHGASIK